MNSSDINNNSNDSLKVNSKKVLWRKNSSHLPGSIILVSNSDLPTSEEKLNDKNSLSSKEPNSSSKEFFEYIFTEENWTENLLTGSPREPTPNPNDNTNNNNNINNEPNNKPKETTNNETVDTPENSDNLTDKVNTDETIVKESVNEQLITETHSNSNTSTTESSTNNNTSIDTDSYNHNSNNENNDNNPSNNNHTENINNNDTSDNNNNNNSSIINDNNNNSNINKKNNNNNNSSIINDNNSSINNNNNNKSDNNNNNSKNDNNNYIVNNENNNSNNINTNSNINNDNNNNTNITNNENKSSFPEENNNLNDNKSQVDDWTLVDLDDKEKEAIDKELKEKSETENKSNMSEETEYSAHKIKQFEELLNTPNIDLVKLRKLSWSGIPKKFRPMVWQLLMGYLPRNQDRREVTLARKRKDFADTANQAFSKGVAGLDYSLYHQIHIDIPRTNPSSTIYQNKKIQKSLERILYCWAIRHPASGYVQGINDLVTPFYYVFLSSYLDSDLETYDIDSIPDNVFEAVEADSFWCLTNLLDGIQDSYTYNQPGIHRQVQKLEEFIKRVDLKLYNHLKKEEVQFIQFAFRWMNCLLMRELKLEHTIRMWDTYQSEPEGFSEFHLYVCAAFLVKWSKQLLEMDFQDIMIFLQNLPTSDWTEKDIEMLLSEAYMWKCLFHDSPNHIS